MNQLSTTTDNFLEAMRSLSPAVEVSFVYRIYYDNLTKGCLFKTIDQPDGCFIEVSRSVYDEVNFCPDYYISSTGKLTKKQVDFSSYKMLQLSNSGYRTVKHNNIFIVGETYNRPTDMWKLRNFDDEQRNN